MIGDNIRKIRKENNLTIKNVAERTNLTQGLISQIENDKANPSINSLKVIAKALNVPIASFFDADDQIEDPVVNKDERKVLQTKNGITYYLLNPTLKNTNIELLYAVYEKDASTGMLYTHEGEEIGIVLNGKLKVTLEKEDYILEPGDSIMINSENPHSMKNIYDGQTIAIWANCPPTF